MHAHLEEANKVLLVFRSQLCNHANIQKHQLRSRIHLHTSTAWVMLQQQTLVMHA